jgi:hypothetical protein
MTDFGEHEAQFDNDYDAVEQKLINIQQLCYRNNVYIFENTTTLQLYLFLKKTNIK